MNDTNSDFEPFCMNCGYQLTGLTDSSKCPECGKPLVDVLTRGPNPGGYGRRYRSPIRVFGLPLIDVAFGPYRNERRGKAFGFIAMGDIATGVFAFGGMSRGIVAFGGMAMGLVSFGGLSLALLVSFGGMSIGGLATGGGAAGVVAQGGGAIGILADGGMAIGYFARGGATFGPNTAGRMAGSPQAQQIASDWAWLIGNAPGSKRFILCSLGFAAGVVVLSLLVLLVGYMFYRTDVNETSIARSTAIRQEHREGGP